MAETRRKSLAVKKKKENGKIYSKSLLSQSFLQ